MLKASLRQKPTAFARGKGGVGWVGWLGAGVQMVDAWFVFGFVIGRHSLAAIAHGYLRGGRDNCGRGQAQ